jgi:hypothetical protein
MAVSTRKTAKRPRALSTGETANAVSIFQSAKVKSGPYQLRPKTHMSSVECALGKLIGNTAKSPMDSDYQRAKGLMALSIGQTSNGRFSFPSTNTKARSWRPPTTRPAGSNAHVLSGVCPWKVNWGNKSSNQRISLNRSQYGGCSTGYNTLTSNQVVCK